VNKNFSNVPNILTIFRILLIPAFVIVFYLPGKMGHFLAAATFSLAAITDWLDGYLARNLNQTTRFGEFLDPVADKLMVAIALVLVVAYLGSAYVAIPAAVIVGREIVISALREWMAEIGKRTSVAVGFIGKIKTAVQMLAMVSLLLYHPKYYSIWLLVFGLLLLYIAAVLTLWSMVMYLKVAWPDLTLFREQE
jgi:CDP-diacylglycerol---glycerol-3-phosphate 3-phosphatidyltransferase